MHRREYMNEMQDNIILIEFVVSNFTDGYWQPYDMIYIIP